MKTARVTLEIEVPVVACGKCGQEAACHAHVVETPDGHLMLQISSPLTPFRIGHESAFLCETCKRFVRGAVEALGLLTPGSPPSEPVG